MNSLNRHPVLRVSIALFAIGAALLGVESAALSATGNGAVTPKTEALRLRPATPGAATAAERAAAVLRDELSGNSPEVFAGVTIDGDSVNLSVTDVRSASTKLVNTRSALARDGNRTPVVLRHVPRSETEFLALQQRVVSEQRQLALLGITVTRVGPSAGLDALEVAVTNSSPQTTAVLQGRYGTDIRVLKEDQWTSTSRRADSTPWWGGIFLDSGTLCTAGFNWLIGSTVHATTAGHCGARTWLNNGTVVGVTSGLRRDVQTDAQILPANAQGFIYNGGLDDFNNVRVGYYYTSQTGDSAFNVLCWRKNFRSALWQSGVLDKPVHQLHTGVHNLRPDRRTAIRRELPRHIRGQWRASVYVPSGRECDRPRPCDR